MNHRLRGLLPAGLVLALVAAACSSNPTVPDPVIGEFTTRTAGTLTVGSDIPYAPFEYNDDDGTLVGFDVELIEAVAEILDLEVEWVNAGFDTIFTNLDGNQFDLVASAVTAYAEQGTPAYETVQTRREIVAFSVPYYSSLQSLTVNTARTPEVRSTADLAEGAKVAVQRGTTGQKWAEGELPGIDLVAFPKAPQMYEGLENGQHVGVIADLPVSLEAIEERPDLEVVQQIDTGEQYGFAVQQDNPDLLEAVNAALRQLFEDGTYRTIFEKYFPDQELPSYAA